MDTVKINSVVDEHAWAELKALASESQQTIGALLTEAIEEFVRRRRALPDALGHAERSMEENSELGRLLAR